METEPLIAMCSKCGYLGFCALIRDERGWTRGMICRDCTAASLPARKPPAVVHEMRGPGSNRLLAAPRAKGAKC